MEVPPVDGAAYFGQKAVAPKQGLDMQQFLMLLAVQMQNQNPLEPMNDRDFFAQMAQLGQVQGLEQVNKSLSVSQAASLMGKEVTAFRQMTETSSGFGEYVTGRVTQLTVKNGEHYIGIKTEKGGIVEVKMSAIVQVKQ